MPLNHVRSFYGNPTVVVPGAAALTSLGLSKITGALEGVNPRLVRAVIRAQLTVDVAAASRWDSIAALLGQLAVTDSVGSLVDGATGLDLAHFMNMDFPSQPFTRDLAAGAGQVINVEWSLPFGRLAPRRVAEPSLAPAIFGASSMLPCAQFLGGDVSISFLAASGQVGNAVTLTAATAQLFLRTVDLYGDRDEPWRRMVTRCFAVDSMSDSYDVAGLIQFAGMRTGITGVTGELGAVPAQWNAGADFTISSEDIAYSEQISNEMQDYYFDVVQPFRTPPSVAPLDEWDGVARGVLQPLFGPEWRETYMPNVCKLQYRASTLALPTTNPVFMARLFESAASQIAASPSGYAAASAMASAAMMTPGGGSGRTNGGCMGHCPRRNRGRCGGC